MTKPWKKSSSNFKLDHSLDHVGGKISDDDSSVNSFPGGRTDKGPVMPDLSDQLETPEEKKARKRSHLVAYTTMFVMSIGFSIVLSGVWPYMKSINNDLEKAALGWVVAANPLGQMLASPILGLWGNKAGSIRGACIATVICFIGGNVMYAMLYAFQDSGENVAYYMMIVARFIVGVSSANVTLCRSYLAGSTTLKERTTGIAVIAAAQALGFVVGPGIQAILTVVVKGSTGSGAFVWDKYTSAGWVAAILGFINLVIVMPGIFQEHYIAEKERKFELENKLEDAAGDLVNSAEVVPIDRVAVCAMLYVFFLPVLVMVFLETIGVPFVSDQYAWEDVTAMVNVGIFLSVGGFCMMFLFYLSGILAKKFDERLVLLLVGIVPLTLGCFFFIPFGENKIKMSTCQYNVTPYEASHSFPTQRFWPGLVQDEDYQKYFNLGNSISEDISLPLKASDRYIPFIFPPVTDTTLQDPTCSPGCPEEQSWCHYVPQLALPQLVVACMFLMAGFPIVQSITLGIYSKLVGSGSQGLWMALLGGVGSISRVVGPITVSYIYTNFGTYWTFGTLTFLMGTVLIVVVLCFERLRF